MEIIVITANIWTHVLIDSFTHIFMKNDCTSILSYSLLLFEAGFQIYCVAILDLKFLISCLSLPNSEITRVYHHAWLSFPFILGNRCNGYVSKDNNVLKKILVAAYYSIVQEQESSHNESPFECLLLLLFLFVCLLFTNNASHIALCIFVGPHRLSQGGIDRNGAASCRLLNWFLRQPLYPHDSYYFLSPLEDRGKTM